MTLSAGTAAAAPPGGAPPYTVRLDVFEGPLDLLLQLIERRQLDVTTVSLALITDQFLEHVSALETVDPDDLASFIVIAAKLLLIKSRALLPGPKTAEPTDDPEDPTDLTERLRRYERIRAAARWLQEREARGLRSYPAAPHPPAPRIRPLRGLDPTDLRRAYLRALARNAPPHPEVTVAREPFPVRRALEALAERLQLGTVELQSWCRSASSRSEIVAVFLAALELIRQGVADCDQTEAFGAITLTKRSSSPVPEPSDNG